MWNSLIGEALRLQMNNSLLRRSSSQPTVQRLEAMTAVCTSCTCAEENKASKDHSMNMSSPMDLTPAAVSLAPKPDDKA
jgi:hypothetical protein